MEKFNGLIFRISEKVKENFKNKKNSRKHFKETR